jgi:hypothetical protein
MVIQQTEAKDFSKIYSGEYSDPLEKIVLVHGGKGQSIQCGSGNDMIDSGVIRDENTGKSGHESSFRFRDGDSSQGLMYKTI